MLILGGTSEARALAALLVAADRPVVSSLAGRVADPALPVGEVRIGGFGGAAGLADYLRRHDTVAVVDATHPFAGTMSASAITACAARAVPLLRLTRPGWAAHPDAGAWHWVDSHADATAAARNLGYRIFLTTGRTTLPSYMSLADRKVVVRLVDVADRPLPASWRLIRGRGPYTVDGETSLMAEHGIQVLVTKDSGGDMTAPKLTAAAALGVQVVMVRRPTVVGSAGVPHVESADQAARWAIDRTGATP